ncbi:MAG TPA: DNA-protecting protein DprA [Ruminococcus sp.]|nr:DNA-protecting protein DprA [Ruminococcus sp.]
MDKVAYWLWLTEIFGTGNERLWTAMKCFGEPDTAYWELCRNNHGLKLNQKELSNIKSVSLENCLKLIDVYNSRGFSVTGFSSPEYPDYLRNIYNPPAVLFYKGDIECLNRMPAITIVGARRSSNQSLMIAERISSELAQNGFVIVSGFARGTDIHSHLGAIRAGCPTVCVMGCGLDIDYPKENFIYRDAVLKNGGVFISEYPLGTPPLQQNFPKRNRILSGVSRGVVIIEAGEKSGSLITAELAVEQNREVFCVPPADIYDRRYAGNIRFLRDGAVAVYGYEDIAGYFNPFENDTEEEIPESDEPEISQEVPENSENSEDSEKTDDLSEFSDIQKEIIRILMQGKTHIDVISDRLGYDVSELVAEITNLEFDDVIQSFPGKIYGLK